MEPVERLVRDSLHLLFQPCGEVPDHREKAKLRHPLRELPCRVTCRVTRASMAGCNGYDELIAAGRKHLSLLGRHRDVHFSIPKEDWLRTGMPRLAPLLF